MINAKLRSGLPEEWMTRLKLFESKYIKQILT